MKGKLIKICVQTQVLKQSSKSLPERGMRVVNGFPTYFCTKNDTDILRSKNNISKVQLFYKYLSSCTYNWEYIEDILDFNQSK